MFRLARRLLWFTGVIRRAGNNFAIIEYIDESSKKTAVMQGNVPELAKWCSNVKFDLKHADGDSLVATAVQLCGDEEATGRIVFYNRCRAYGIATTKQGQTVALFPREMTDTTFAEHLLKARAKQRVRFEVRDSEHGTLAVDVQGVEADD